MKHLFVKFLAGKYAENKEKKLAIGRDFIIIVNRSAKAAVLFQKGKRIRL